MKLTGNVVFEKTFDTYFFIAANFHSEGVKMRVKVWGEIHIWSNISETITDRKKINVTKLQFDARNNTT